MKHIHRTKSDLNTYYSIVMGSVLECEPCSMNLQVGILDFYSMEMKSLWVAH